MLRLRSVSTFQCMIGFSSNFISSAQVRKQNQIKKSVILRSQQQQSFIHHFSMHPRHHEQSKQLNFRYRKQFQTNPHCPNQHVSECIDTVPKSLANLPTITLLLLVNFNTFPTGSPSLVLEPVEHKCTAATCL